MIFFHTADIHFGVENYGKIDQETGVHSRLLDFKKAFSLLVDQAIKERIDFVVFSGDAYKTAYPTPTQQKLLAQQFLRLQQAGIPVVIIVGNHDHPLSFGKAHALDLFGYLPMEGFHVFARPDLITLKTKSGPVQIVGIPWPTRNNVIAQDDHRFKSNKEIADYLAQRVNELITYYAQKINPAHPAILAGHLTVSSGIFSGSEKCAIYGTDPLFFTSQLALPVFDYVALGHLHRYQNLNSQSSPAVVYSGSIERVDFGERKEEKGFCRVQITQKESQRTCSHSFIALPSRPMIQIDVTITSSGVPQTEQVINAVKEHHLAEAIVKILYHLPADKKDNVDILAVTRAARDAFYLVGIFPVYSHPIKPAARTKLSVSMDFEMLLEKYLASKTELKSKKSSLLEKGKELYLQLDTKLENKDEAE